MKCALNWTERFERLYNCTSEVLQEWLFVTSQYVVISRKLAICDYDVQKLRNLVNNLGKIT